MVNVVSECDLLAEIFPGIWGDKAPRTRCPAEVCKTSRIAAPLPIMIAHLNDKHRWPRTERDRSENNTGLPTIHGWLKEESEKNGWDLTCQTPQP